MLRSVLRTVSFPCIGPQTLSINTELILDYKIIFAPGQGWVPPLSPPLISQRETTNNKQERCQDKIATDVLRMRKYEGCNFSGAV